MSNFRVGTSSNLQSGGSYDLLLVKFVGTFPEGQITFGIYDTPMKITGLQKVAQVFLKILLTSKGSDPFYPQRGTFLAENVVNANRKSSTDVFMAEVKEYIQDAEKQTKACLNASNPDTSSCLDSVDILSVDALEDSLTISVYLTTLDGAGAAIAVPFPEFGLSA